MKFAYFSTLLFFVCHFIFFEAERRISLAKLERDFQARLIKELKQRFAGCMVLKNDSSYLQGVPDLLVLYNDHWATLEVKRSSSAKHRPNQAYYVDLMDKMSFSRFICPENKDEVLGELQGYFQQR